jgi:hypothetical protein
MHVSVTVTPAQLPELLLHIAVVRPVFIWGGPAIPAAWPGVSVQLSGPVHHR